MRWDPKFEITKFELYFRDKGQSDIVQTYFRTFQGDMVRRYKN